MKNQPKTTKPKMLSWPTDLPSNIELPYSELFYDWVLLYPVDVNTDDDSGVTMPRQYNDKWDTGVVLMAGDGKVLENGERMEMPVEQFDVVRFEGYSAREETYKGHDFLLVRQEDLRGKHGQTTD